MGSALVMFTIPEEMLSGSHGMWLDRDGERQRHLGLHLRDPETGELRPMTAAEARGSPSEILQRHPDACLLIAVRLDAVWDPPDEPWREHGAQWHRDRSLRKQHRQNMRESLERFINGKLEELSGMVRTGWWVLERARVRVTQMKPVPQWAFERRARWLRGDSRGDKRG